MITHIYLRGGAVITIDLEQFVTTGTGDGLSKLNWTAKESEKLRLHHVNLDEVAAITVEVE